MGIVSWKLDLQRNLERDRLLWERVNSSVCAFLLPGEILPGTDRGFRNLTKVLGKQLSGFFSWLVSLLTFDWVVLQEAGMRIDWGRWCFPCCLFPFTEVESSGKVLVWCPLVTRSPPFPKVLRTIGGISLSFWLVYLFALKLNSVLQVKGGGSQPQGLGAGSSGNFNRIWWIPAVWGWGRCPPKGADFVLMWPLKRRRLTGG